MIGKRLTRILAVVFSIACVFGCAACDNKEPTAHVHNYQWVDNGNGTHKQHCAVDGCDAPDINGDSHDFSNGNCVCGKVKPVTHTHNYQWVDNGDGTHKQHCAVSGCDAPDISGGSHDFSDGDCVCGKEKPTEGLSYEPSDDGKSYCVTGLGTAQATDIIIAEKYDGKPVTSVSAEAFKDCGITSVIIPQSVTEIGFAAFEGCNSLADIALPFVGASKDCEENFHFGYIFGAADFEGNRSAVPSTLKNVAVTGGSAINTGAFYLCLTIENIVLPHGITSIGEYAFAGCVSLEELDIPDGVTQIGEAAFLECAKLRSISVPDSLTLVEDGAFAYCEVLRYNEYDNALYLGNDENPYVVLVKEKDEDITSCVINKNVKCILSDAWEYCSLLENIALDESNTAYCVYDGILYNKAKTELLFVPEAIKGERVIPDGVTQIVRGDFGGRENLVGITIPNTVTTIEQRSFQGCISLESISLPFVGIKVKGTGNMCFGYIFGDNESNRDVPSSLHTVVITGDGSLGHGAFNGCTHITTVKILGKMKSFGNMVFYNCTSLTDIVFNGTRAEWRAISKGTQWNSLTNYTITFSDGETITKDEDN